MGTLDEPLRSAAEAAGYRSLVVLPVRDDVDGQVGTALVLWHRVGLPITVNQSQVLARAATVASLALGRERISRRLREAAFLDPLTGLGNRRHLLGSVADGLAAAGGSAAVLFVDFDSFKEVNDRHGHQAGDEVLLEAARRLASAIRPSDEVVRLGGDEFAVICHGRLAVEQVTAIAERIIASMSAPILVPGGPAPGATSRFVTIGASVGIAHGYPDGTALETLLASADSALLEAKANGKGRWHLIDPPAPKLTLLDGDGDGDSTATATATATRTPRP